MKIPCEECLVLSVCRHKSFSRLVTECRILREVNNTLATKTSDGYLVFIVEVQDVLNPTEWEYRRKGK